jgi:hypothetical protein
MSKVTSDVSRLNLWAKFVVVPLNHLYIYTVYLVVVVWCAYELNDEEQRCYGRGCRVWSPA